MIVCLRAIVFEELVAAADRMPEDDEVNMSPAADRNEGWSELGIGEGERESACAAGDATIGAPPVTGD
jgi:hypothetical protein